mgnify:CR=1 FL=1
MCAARGRWRKERREGEGGGGEVSSVLSRLYGRSERSGLTVHRVEEEHEPLAEEVGVLDGLRERRMWISTSSERLADAEQAQQRRGLICALH